MLSLVVSTLGLSCYDSGWRDSGVTGGTKECPGATKARGSMDGHMCSGSKGVCDEADCCQANCWLSGWRNAGDTSGTQQCPATTEARSVTDGHPPEPNSGAAPGSECCKVKCGKSGFLD